MAQDEIKLPEVSSIEGMTTEDVKQYLYLYPRCGTIKTAGSGCVTLTRCI